MFLLLAFGAGLAGGLLGAVVLDVKFPLVYDRLTFRVAEFLAKNL